MEEVAKKLKAKALYMEELAKKLNVLALDFEAAGISDLSDCVILKIVRFLNIEDTIAFAFTCQRFRRICMDEGMFRRVDLSRHAMLRMEQGAINVLLRNTQVSQQITELNISNVRVFNWQMDDQLEEFIILICPHLEALHAVNCGMSLQTLHRILQNAPKLTCLSWSLWDITAKDIVFICKSIESRSTQTLSTNSMSSDMKSADEIYLKNIKHLHLEMFPSKPHIQILKYLVLLCTKDLEELKIYTWLVDKDCYTEQLIPLEAHQKISCIPWQFTAIDLFEHLHSLTVVELGSTSYSCSLTHYIYRGEIRDFICSVVKRKSRRTNWRKFWISPPIHISRLHDLFHLSDPSVPLNENHSHELHSVEEITASAGRSLNAVDEWRALLQRIDEKTVRSISLSFGTQDEIHAEQNIFIHTLFSNCSNITELDLLHCYFLKDICEPLSKLRHLTKVQLRECAISSKYNRIKVKISRANLRTFVENCKNIKHFDVRYCHMNMSCRLTDTDMLVLAKLSNLESLTLDNISAITKWTFLQNMSENYKFLTMLRITDTRFKFNDSHIPMLMESAKFLKHLALHVQELDLQSEDFWNLLSQAKNMERLCIRISVNGSINVPLAVGTLMSLPRLQVLHLHLKENDGGFHREMIRMLELENSNRSSFFELVTEETVNRNFKKALPLNIVELCNMTPMLSIPRF